MKELEKTQRISIAAVVSILAVIIGLLTYKRPKVVYNVTPNKTLEKITNTDYFASLNDINEETNVLIDVRNTYEYEKGNLANAINISTPEILEDDNKEIFENIKENNKTALLYGSSPNEVVAPYMMLYQLGYDNIKILAIENSYDQNQLISKNVEVEKPVADVKSFIEESVKKVALLAKQKPKPVVTVKKAPKKVIPVKKKKKLPVEGGC